VQVVVVTLPQPRAKPIHVAYSLLLGGLLGGLGSGTGHVLGSHSLDDADSDGLPHVTDSETSKRGEVGESLNAHGLGWVQDDDASVSGLEELGVLLS